MSFAAAALSAGRGLIGSVNARRGKRRRPRKLTTSQAAIRRFEQRKRGGTGRGTPKPRRPWGPQGGPRADARPTGGGRRTSRTSQIAINRSRNKLGPTPSKGRKRTTSQSAIARYKAMRGRKRR